MKPIHGYLLLCLAVLSYNIPRVNARAVGRAIDHALGEIDLSEKSEIHPDPKIPRTYSDNS
jgi:DNA-binding protein